MSSETGTRLTDKQQYWHDHIQQAKTNQQSLSDYAHQHELNLKALYHYHWLLRKKGLLDAPSQTPAFVKVAQSTKPTQHSTFTIHFPNGISVELTSIDHALPALLDQVSAL
jgi:hypothetical protein